MPINEFLHSDFWIRMLLYGVLGYVGEVWFTALADFFFPKFLCSWNIFGNQSPTTEQPVWRNLKDMRLVGYSFLWMAPIYSLLVFMEPLTYYLSALAWPIRGLIYASVFILMEYVSGFLFKLILGKCPWDYSYHKYSVHGFTRWDFFPVWFVSSLIIEKCLPYFIKLTPHLLHP